MSDAVFRTASCWHPTLLALTVEQREVLVLAAVGDSTCTEISQIMGIDRDRVHRVLRRAVAGAGVLLGAAPDPDRAARLHRIPPNLGSGSE